jgi:membrane protein required for colicin V production
MNTLDIILAAILLFGLVRGFMKGLFVELATLVALLLGVYGAIHFSYLISDFLVEKVSWDQQYINITAFALTFIVIVIVISLSGKALTKLANFAALGILNRVLGAVFGVSKFGLILSVLLLVFHHINKGMNFIDKESLATSVLYAPVKSIAPTIFPSIIKKGTEELKQNIGI